MVITTFEGISTNGSNWVWVGIGIGRGGGVRPWRDLPLRSIGGTSRAGLLNVGDRNIPCPKSLRRMDDGQSIRGADQTGFGDAAFVRLARGPSSWRACIYLRHI